MNPPHLLIFLFVLLAGGGLGIGTYTFVYAKGASYLSNDPRACANCHVMNEQYQGWLTASHRQVAACNDCHTPHNFFGKYLTKAINGFNHSLAFTMGGFHEPIQITERNLEITEGTCRSCHPNVTESILAGAHFQAGSDNLRCTRCHDSVGHPH